MNLHVFRLNFYVQIAKKVVCVIISEILGLSIIMHKGRMVSVCANE